MIKDLFLCLRKRRPKPRRMSKVVPGIGGTHRRGGSIVGSESQILADPDVVSAGQLVRVVMMIDYETYLEFS